MKLSPGEEAIADIANSFKKVPDQKKRNILLAIYSVAAVVQYVVYVLWTWPYIYNIDPSAMNSLDLGDFKPLARKAPVIEIDEVFGNQFVKEKKDTSALPANEAGGTVDGEGVVDLDVDGSGSGGNAPNIARCAVRNFPAEAKAYVDEALVPIQITVDKTGIVREAKPLYVQINKDLPPDLKARLKTLFMNAARTSLLGRRCPIYSVAGSPKPYKLEVPLSYELYN